MKQTLIIFFFTFSINVFGQNTFFVGDKTYDSTDEYELLSNEQIGGQDLIVTIAKSGEAGLFIVSAMLFEDSFRIKGKLLIYLDDKTVITCTDKGKYDYVDNTATTIYNLTKEEIYKLSLSNIYSVRFSIGSIHNDIYGGSIGSHSVRNHPKDGFFTNKPRIDFPTIISDLLKI